MKSLASSARGAQATTGPDAVARRERRRTVARLRAFMERRGWSEEDCANRLGIDGGRFWAMLGGNAGATETERERIETMLRDSA